MKDRSFLETKHFGSCEV